MKRPQSESGIPSATRVSRTPRLFAWLALALSLNMPAAAVAVEPPDADGDGVQNSEDAFPTDPARYVRDWRQNGWPTVVPNAANGFRGRAATNGPLAVMWDGSCIWTVDSTSRQSLQAVWREAGVWQSYQFTGHPPVKLSGNICTDSGWNIVWYVGQNDNNIYATYWTGSTWLNAAVTSSRDIERIQHVDPQFHIVWARRTDGRDVAVYLDNGIWKTANVAGGAATPGASAKVVSWAGMISSARGSIGWDLDGNLYQRPLVNGAWVPQIIPQSGKLGTIGAGIHGFQTTRYGIDSVNQWIWYGTERGQLGWTSLATNVPVANTALGAPGSVMPHSPTYACNGGLAVFCMDGYLQQDKIRYFYFSGGAWRSAIVGECKFSSGEQAAATSSHKLFYIDVSTGRIEYLGFAP